MSEDHPDFATGSNILESNSVIVVFALKGFPQTPSRVPLKWLL